MDREWQHIKEELQKSLSRGQYDLWVSTLNFSGVEKNRLILSCRNRLHIEWLREKLEKQLLAVAGRYFPGILGVDYRIVADEPPRDEESNGENGPRQITFQDIVKQPISPLNPRFTFDQFVVGASNQFAYSAAMSMANDQQIYNQSVYLLSETGLGKSHLSQAVGNHLRVKRPDMRVRYVTAEQFANEMIFSLKNGSIENFKKRYREGCDLLLMERIEFLSGKEKIQSELVYTLDELLDRGKKVICTGKTYPRDIPKLSTDLQSRLNGILVTPIEPPDFKTRVEIIKRKSRNENIHIPTEVAEFLAERVVNDVRQLESCLVGVIAKSNILGVPISLSLVRDVAQTMLTHLPQLTVEYVQEIVCSSFKTSVNELRSKGRRKEIALARKVAMYLCRQYTSESLINIGKAFNRSHSAVVYSLNKISKEMEAKNGKLKRQVEYVSRRLETSCLYS